MRPKILLCVLIPALAILTLLGFFRPQPRAGTSNYSATAQPDPRDTATTQPSHGTTNVLIASVSAGADKSAVPTTLAQGQVADGESISKRVEELGQLAMEDDTASLATILGALDDSDPKIRQAALQASVQFGSRDAIPKLEEAAAKAEDPRMKRALQEAIEFLKLPSLTEVLAERRQVGNP